MANRATTTFTTFFLIAFATVLFVCVVNGQTRSKPKKPSPHGKSQTQSPPTPEVPTDVLPNPSTVSPSEIADEERQLKQRLRGLSDRLPTEDLLAELERRANRLRETTVKMSTEIDAAVDSGATISDLQQSLVDLQSLGERVSSLSETLSTPSIAITEEIQSLRVDRERWEKNIERIKASESPAELADLSQKALDNITAADKLAETQNERIIAVQKTISAQGVIISGEIENVRKAVAVLQRSLLVQDSPPLWKIQFNSQDDETVTRLLGTSYSNDLTRLKYFLFARRRSLFAITLLCVAALVFFVKLAAHTRGKEYVISGSLTEPYEIFGRPVSLALMLGLVAMTPLLPQAPISVKGFFDLLVVIPVLRILIPHVKQLFRKMLIALIASILIWELIKFVQWPLWIKRDLLAVISLVIVALFFWLARAQRQEGDQLKRGSKIVLTAVHTCLALIAISLLANIFGYVGLSDLIASGTLISAYRAASIYTIFIVGNFLIGFGLQTSPARRLAVIRNNSARLGSRLAFTLALIMLFVWLNTTLNLFALRDDLYSAIASALNYQITFGTATIVPRNLVIFVLTLFFGYLMAVIVRAIMSDEVLPRLHLTRGLSNAVATLTHYIALLLIFIFALAAAGLELSKFTILTGALGVGLGFGLQTIVNNFVSGLILLVERPVRVGDYLEIGPVNGEVTSIGFRSSTLHSTDGADLIIPNANLISQQVINWTLSGTARRVILPIRVAYGSDPEKVRDLLASIVTGYPNVLESPKPVVLFLGFGESSLDFQVFFWSPNTDIAAQLKSDVALKIIAEFRNTGIKIPYPQRELHVKGIDQVARKALAAGEEGANK